MSIHSEGPDDRDQWMTMFGTLDDESIDALLHGRAPEDNPDLDGVAAVVQRLRESAAQEPVPAMSAALRAQLLQPHVVPLVPAGHARRSLRAGVLVAAVAAAVALLGVGAGQNRLPANVQDVVSSVADVVGIDVPRAEERTESKGGSGADDDHGATGQDGSTRGGAGRGGPAVPADPGQPADKEPATPATPPEHSSGGGVAGGGVEGTPGATAPGRESSAAGGGTSSNGGASSGGGSGAGSEDVTPTTVPANPVPPTTVPPARGSNPASGGGGAGGGGGRSNVGGGTSDQASEPSAATGRGQAKSGG